MSIDIQQNIVDPNDAPIYFYGHSKNNPYGCFSNFYKSPFIDANGILFNYSETYLMYHKCLTFDPNNEQMKIQILTADNPARAKKLGRQVKNFDENKWKQVRERIMYDALMFKFSQGIHDENIKQILIDTGTRILYEAAKNDRIWGIGYSSDIAPTVNKTQYGLNLLGKTLMQVRNTL